MIDKKLSILGLVFISVLTLQACNEDGTNTASQSDTIDPPPQTTAGSVTQIFEPRTFVRLPQNEGALMAELESGDRFGRDHDRAGDINGDGIDDLIFGARSDDDGATDAGAAYVLFMNADGGVDSHQKISALHGNFSDELVAGSFFGYGVAGIGDYDGDNVPDVAISAPAAPVPAIYILHLESDGTVKSMVKNTGIVGQGLSAIGDRNNDGRIDLVAAEPGAIGGGLIHLLFFDQSSALLRDETVSIGEDRGGFGTGLLDGDSFGGRESALLGDLDDNGTQELAVGAFESENGLGAIWILSLDNDSHEVVDKLKLAPGLAGFDEIIPLSTNVNGTTGGHFGHALVAAGDLNGDGIPDLITSANQYDDGVGYILYLNADKTIKTFTRITANEGGFDLSLTLNERFGRSMSIVDDNRADGQIVVNMGGGAGSTGAVYALNFRSCEYQKQGMNMFWDEGTTLFTNWDHATQTVTGPLSQEQCVLKTVENDAPYMTFKESDGRCIVKDASAVLSVSDEGSSAFVRSCP